MRLKIGSAIRPERESAVSISYSYRFDAARRMMSVVQRWDITGNLVPETKTQQAMSAAVRKLRSDLLQNGVKICYLLEDSSEESELKLLATNAISGPRVVNFSLPGDGMIYSSVMPWVVSYEAEYAATSRDVITEFSETVEEDPGGPSFVQVGGMVRMSRRQQTMQSKPWNYVQSGSATGMFSYPPIPPPLFPFAQSGNPRIVRSSPRNYGAVNTEFTISWNYHFSWHVQLFANPHVMI